MVRLFFILMAATTTASCGGEITTIEFGDAQEVARERFAEEIFPILHLQETGTTETGGLYSRNCSAPNCHGGENARGGVTIAPEINEENALATFRTVITNGDVILGDADNSEFLQRHLTDPPLCFSGPDDCCFRKIEAWINDAESPACNCPEEPD